MQCVLRVRLVCVSGLRGLYLFGIQDTRYHSVRAVRNVPIFRFAYCFLYRRLVAFGIGHLFLNVVCSALCLGIGVDSNVDTAIAVAVLCSHIQNVIVLGED